MKKQQILMIHGGTPFETYEEYLEYLKAYPLEKILKKKNIKRWKDNLQKNLGEDFEVIFPDMPKNFSIKYNEWKIWMEKFLPLLRERESNLSRAFFGGNFLTKIFKWK